MIILWLTKSKNSQNKLIVQYFLFCFFLFKIYCVRLKLKIHCSQWCHWWWWKGNKHKCSGQEWWRVGKELAGDRGALLGSTTCSHLSLLLPSLNCDLRGQDSMVGYFGICDITPCNVTLSHMFYSVIRSVCKCTDMFGFQL